MNINLLEKLLLHPSYLQKGNSNYKKAIVATFSTLVIAILFISYSIYFLIHENWNNPKNISNLIAICIFLIFFALFKFQKNINIPLMFINLSIIPVLYLNIQNTGGLLSPDMPWILFTLITCTVFVNKYFGVFISVASIFFISHTYIHTLDSQVDKHYFTWLFLIILIESVLFAFTYSLNKTDEKIEQLNKEKLTILDNELHKIIKKYGNLRSELARDFHDEMGNKLATIKILSENLKNKIDMNLTTDFKTDLSNIEQNCKKLTDGTRDFIWSIDWKNNSLNSFFEYLREFTENILDANNIHFLYQNTLTDKTKNTNLQPFYLRNLLLICKEIITNTVKHSQANRLTINVKLIDEKLVLEIADNGIGFNSNEINTKRGLQNIKIRAEKINTTIITQNINGTNYQIYSCFKNFNTYIHTNPS